MCVRTGHTSDYIWSIKNWKLFNIFSHLSALLCRAFSFMSPCFFESVISSRGSRRSCRREVKCLMEYWKTCISRTDCNSHSWVLILCCFQYLECGELVLYVSLEGLVDSRHGVGRLLPEVQQCGLPWQGRSWKNDTSKMFYLNRTEERQGPTW